MNTVTIIGRPNTGKSTLFNMMVGKRLAITHQQAGVTRDIKRVTKSYCGHEFCLIDTGGITDEGVFAKQISTLSYTALDQTDLVLLLVSVEEITAEDEELIDFVRKLTLPHLLVVNKVDNEAREWAASEYYRHGLGEPVMVSALHRSNLEYLWQQIAEKLHIDLSIPAESDSVSETTTEAIDSADSMGIADSSKISVSANIAQNIADETKFAEEVAVMQDSDVVAPYGDQSLTDINEVDTTDELSPIRLLIMGKPNTGKSSLLNTMLGKDRAMVSEMPGTTRDIIEEEVDVKGEKFILIDSAGIRKKNKIYDDIEYYSSHRAISAIENSDVILLMIDVIEGLSEQDKKLASIIIRQGKGLVIALNKWDLIQVTKNRLAAEKDRISYLVPQLHFVPITPISAKNNTGLDQAIAMVKKVHAQLQIKINTSLLNRDVHKWIESNPPPLVGRRRGKLKFIAQSSINPIVFQARVNTHKLFSESYKQFIINKIRNKYAISNVPIRLDLVYNT